MVLIFKETENGIVIRACKRCCSALGIFFHIKSMFETSSPFVYQLSQYGSLGVPMFFVISGYVITLSAESNLKNNKSPFAFLKARFLRIYPAFWASVIVVLLTPYVIESISALKSGEYIIPENIFTKFNHIEWSNFLLLTKVFWATSHDLQAEFNSVNSVYWTLAIEFQFYLVVSLALYFRKYYRHIIFIISIAAILTMFIPNKINFGLFIHYWPSFSVGILLAYLYRNGVQSVSLLKNKAVLIVTSLFATVLLISSVNFLGPRAILFAVCFGLFLWTISDIEKTLNKIKNSENLLFFWLLEPWLVLGTMSYSVYLLHGKIYHLPDMFVRQLIDPDNILYGVLIVIGTLLLCYPFYFFVERRFLSKNYKIIQQKVLTKVSSGRS
jgi:peptidoglycan/LPS O-acetylase OafA/YrhL